MGFRLCPEGTITSIFSFLYAVFPQKAMQTSNIRKRKVTNEPEGAERCHKFGMQNRICKNEHHTKQAVFPNGVHSGFV